jgi:hypothetical protein
MSVRLTALLFFSAFCADALAVGAKDLLGTWEAARSPEGERVSVRLMEKGKADTNSRLRGVVLWKAPHDYQLKADSQANVPAMPAEPEK